MYIFKFGGASVKNADAVRNVAQIIQNYYTDFQLVAIISAMDKTTNHLEELAKFATQNQVKNTWNQFHKIQDFHYQIIDELFKNKAHEVKQKTQPFFDELKAITSGILLLGDYPNRIWDKIMAFGELISTKIIAEFLQYQGIDAEWKDSRNFIITDHQFRSADILWKLTSQKVQESFQNLQKGKVIIAQGYIGSTQDGKTTTLGREGSDYTASVLGSILNAEKVIVWKDVAGIMSADPKVNPDAQKIDFLSYEQAIEMTFYGATVIHPKTIKPLKNKNIPLEVKCFSDIQSEGTLIGIAGKENIDKSIRITKKNVVSLTIQPKDFSFMDENWTLNIYHYATKAKIRVLLVQTSAISLQMCVENDPTSIQEFQNYLSEEFIIHLVSNLNLHSLLNCTEPTCFENSTVMAQKIKQNYHWVSEK